MLAALILAGSSLLASSPQDAAIREARLMSCFIDAATGDAALRPLIDSCSAGSREERRFWLVGPRGAVYLLRLQGPTVDRPLDGELFLFRDHRWLDDAETPRDGAFCDLLGLDVVAEADRLGVALELDWSGVVEQIDDWQSIDAVAVGRGKRSLLKIVGEGCLRGVYDADVVATEVWQPSDMQRAATAVRGLILGIGAGEWAPPSRIGSLP